MRYVLPALLLAAALAALALLPGRAPRRESEVFPYRDGGVREVPAAKISHRETGSWRVPVEPPAFLAVLPDGRVAVAGGCAVAILDANGVAQARITWQGGAATAVAAAPDGRLFVGTGDRVLDAGGAPGQPVAAWESLGEQARIAGLAASSNEVWVGDAGQRLVWRFDHGGRLLGRLPPPGAPREEAFVTPSPVFPVAALPDGTFWVANPGRNRLQFHAADGRLLRAWSRPGMDLGSLSGCCNPAYFALAAGGAFVTSEQRIARVKIHGQDGAFRSVVAPPAAFAGDEGRPVAVDRAGRVLVLDGSRIRLFEPGRKDGRTEERKAERP
jgi:hypothetical protein